MSTNPPSLCSRRSAGCVSIKQPLPRSLIVLSYSVCRPVVAFEVFLETKNSIDLQLPFTSRTFSGKASSYELQYDGGGNTGKRSLYLVPFKRSRSTLQRPCVILFFVLSLVTLCRH